MKELKKKKKKKGETYCLHLLNLKYTEQKKKSNGIEQEGRSISSVFKMEVAHLSDKSVKIDQTTRNGNEKLGGFHSRSFNNLKSNNRK
jgi:predicted nucleic acid-binding Zn finger protein